MQWVLSDIATATGGRLHGGDAVAVEVGIDSRRLRPGSLFVALRAARDGHAFVDAAIEREAVGVMVDRHSNVVVRGTSAVAVEDTAKALLDLGRAARARLTAEVAGITGSVGKTSTKDLSAAAVGAEKLVAASQASFNNELGVPLTLANAPEATEVALVEMGARAPGHIALLCDVARPTIAVVTAVAAAHTEVFGDLDSVARAKSELVEALDPGGVAILNADDLRVAAMSAVSAAPVIRYSAGGTTDADLVAQKVVLDEELRPSFDVRSPWGRSHVDLGARGEHQVGNALAALAVACRCGVSLEAASAALAGAELSPWRMELSRTMAGALVLNDSYNANPASMAAALRSLAGLAASRRIAVLGVMAELGARSRSEHMAVASLAGELGVDVVAVGTEDYGVAPAADADDALTRLGNLGPGDAVLVKASRAAGLEKLAARLIEQA